MFPPRIPTVVTGVLSSMLPDSVTCPPLIRPISLMQVTWKAQSSSMSLKKSLVHPVHKIDPGHRQWSYRSYVAQLEQEGNA